jgi:hypothetical protein
MTTRISLKIILNPSRISVIRPVSFNRLLKKRIAIKAPRRRRVPLSMIEVKRSLPIDRKGRWKRNPSKKVPTRRAIHKLTFLKVRMRTMKNTMPIFNNSTMKASHVLSPSH